MSFWDIILLPIQLGLIGFFEPCSLGINSIFLAHISKLKTSKRVGETILFALIRAFFLSLVGLSAAFVGKKVFQFQSSYFIILGIFYMLIGIFYIISKYKSIPLPTINILKFFKKEKLSTVSMGIIFGFVIPACAIPLLLVLIGKTLLTGNLAEGFVSLFLFGLSLSLPLIFISYSRRADRIMSKIKARVQNFPIIVGIVLIVLGIATALSSYWWFSSI